MEAQMDVDALTKALEPPTITVGGKTYTGKILSLHQMLPLIKRFEDMGDSVAVEELAALLGDTFEAAGFPVTVTEQIPLAVMDEVLSDFFERQVAGQNRKTRRATK
jgi:hypothetical protein